MVDQRVPDRVNSEGTERNYHQQDFEPFNRLHYPVWIFDITRKKMWWANTAALRLWDGNTLDQLLDRDFSNDISSMTSMRLESYQEQFEQGRSVFEQWNFFPLGRPVSVSCSCSGIRIDDGRLAMLVEGREIQDQTIKEDVLRGIEALRYTPAMISLFDLEGHVVFQNPAATQAFGHPGRGTVRFHGRFLDPQVAAAAWSATLAGETFQGEHCLVTRHGEQWHAIQCRLNEDPVTGSLMVLMHQQDVTEKHTAQERYRQLYIANKAPMLLIDPADASIQDANRAAADYYGYTIETLITMKISDINTLSQPEVFAEMARAKSENRSHFFFRHRLASGEVRDVEVHSGPVMIGQRQLLYSIVHDITERRLTEEALKQSEHKYRSLIQNTPAGFWMIDTGRKTIEVNDALCRLLGYTRDEMLGEPPLRFLDGASAEIFDRQDFTSTRRIYEVACRHKAGHSIPVSVHATAMRDSNGTFLGSFAFVSDLSEMKRMTASLEKLSSAVEHTGSTVMITDARGVIEYVNPHFESLTGFSAEEAVGKTPAILRSDDQQVAIYRQLWSTISKGETWSGELHNRTKDGALFWNLLTISPIRDAAGDISSYVGIGEDVTALKEAYAKAERLSLYDTLTGLANRRLFMDRLEQAIKDIRRSGGKVALLYLDLDRFKDVNDTLGHATGDRLLKQVAERLLTCVRENDTVARLGGDEFSILLLELQDSTDALRVVQKILNVMAQPSSLTGSGNMITASIGITLAPDDGETAEELMRNADMAMYSAKARGKNTYQFFTAEINEKVTRRLTIERELYAALKSGQLELHYQPVVEIASRRIIGAEALLRWNRPDEERIGPDEFIAVAEASDLILELGNWVINRTCRDAGEMAAAGINLSWISLNISARQFLLPGFFSQISDAVATHDLQPPLLKLELTEHALMEQTDDSVTSLYRLKESGMGLAIDDFGTGFSSLTYLRNYPFDTLKIDRSFVRDITVDRADCELVNATIAMAHGLGLQVVAEGVETEAQLAHLASQGCEYAQGYLFSRAIPASEFVRLYRHPDAIAALALSPGEMRV